MARAPEPAETLDELGVVYAPPPKTSLPPLAAARAAFALRSALHRLGDALLPAEVVAFEQTIGIMTTDMLAACCEHGVFDALDDGPATSAQLAERCEVDADALHRMLRALAVKRVVAIDREGRFRLTRTGKALRRANRPSLSAWSRHLMGEATHEAYRALSRSLSTGEPAFRARFGTHIWEHYSRHPDEERLFAESMRNMTNWVAPAIVAGYPWPAEGTICDVAGGTGTLVAAILREHEGLRGVVVDSAVVLEEADAYLSAAGVRDRVELREGDMFDEVEAEADIYLLKDILHDWDDERCDTILEVTRAAMPAGSRLVLVEGLQEPDEPDPVNSLVDIQMLAHCDGGRQRSVAELHTLLQRAGLRPGEVHRTAAASMVEGIAA